MRAAFHYYLTQAWTADRYPQAHRDAPARAASRARHSPPFSPQPTVDSAPGSLPLRRTQRAASQETAVEGTTRT